MVNWYLRNGQLLQNGQFQHRDILVSEGRVEKIGSQLELKLEAPVTEIDLQGMIVSRGFVDLHVHLREPGFSDKETVATGTQAAARGGFTTVCAMPNTSPTLDNSAVIKDFIAYCQKQASVQVVPIGAISQGRAGQQLVDLASLQALGVTLFSDDGDGVTANLGKLAMENLKDLGGIFINHLEDPRFVTAGYSHTEITRESEIVMLKRDLAWVRDTHCPYHVAHVSCGESVELIAQAKQAGLPVTAEVTPHHLVLSAADIREPIENYVMKPPLRTEWDREALVQGLAEHVIDCVATDHAPHGSKKTQPWPFGVVGLETAFPVLYTKLVKSGKLKLERLLTSLSASPAKILGTWPELAVGSVADLTVIDLQATKTVTAASLVSKGKNSPFLDWNLQGWPVLTMVHGKQVYRCPR